MEKKLEITATNYEEAMKIAVEKFHVSSDNIFINTVEERENETVFEALIDVNLALEGKKYLEGILKNLGIEYQIEVRTKGGEEEIHYVIESNENPLLIGVKGRTLEALTLLLKNLIGCYTKEKIVISLDVGSYKANRIHMLEIMATKTAKEVAKTKVDAKLQPMNSFERRIIHEKLSEWRDVYTESEGEGENRAIVIKAVKK
ncbi:MAG: protein jag [Anaeroplasmataceae bacterium]